MEKFFVHSKFCFTVNGLIPRRKFVGAIKIQGHERKQKKSVTVCNKHGSLFHGNIFYFLKKKESDRVSKSFEWPLYFPLCSVKQKHTQKKKNLKNPWKCFSLNWTHIVTNVSLLSGRELQRFRATPPEMEEGFVSFIEQNKLWSKCIASHLKR